MCIDVSGAGDTVVAAFTLGLVASMEVEAAARLSNWAGEKIVQKLGVSTLTQQELIDTVKLKVSQVD